MIDDGALEGDAYVAFFEGPLSDLAFPDDSGIPRDFLVRHDGQEIAVFSAGWGDGIHFSHRGFAAQGCPCALVTRFGVFDGGYLYGSTVDRPPGPRARNAPPFAIRGRDVACVESQGREASPAWPFTFAQISPPEARPRALLRPSRKSARQKACGASRSI